MGGTFLPLGVQVDIDSLSRWVPASSFWLTGIGSTLSGGKPLEPELERIRRQVAGLAIACLEDVVRKEGAAQEQVLLHALVLCEAQKPEWLGSLFLVCLEAARLQPAALAEIPALAKAAVPASGWWSLFDPSWDGGEVPLGWSGLAPAMDLNLRMALRLRRKRAATGLELLQDLEELPGLARRDGARTLAAYLRRQPVLDLAPRSVALELPLRIQLLLAETPALAKALFGQEGRELGLDHGTLWNRWRRVKALALQEKNLERRIRERRWEKVARILAGLDGLPDTQDLLPFSAGFIKALKSPEPCPPPRDAPPWGMTVATGKSLGQLICQDPEGLRILGFLSVSGRDHVRRAIANPSMLRRRPTRLPIPDWDGFLQFCRSTCREELTSGLRPDLLVSLAAPPFLRRPKAFLPLLGNPAVKLAFRQHMGDPAVMRSLVTGFEGKNGSIAKAILAGWVVEDANKLEHFELFLGSLANVRKLDAFLSAFTLLPRNREIFLAALGKLDKLALKKRWVTWLLALTPHHPSESNPFLSLLLNGSPNLQAWCVTQGHLDLGVCRLLEPGLRIQVLGLGSRPGVRLSQTSRSKLFEWAGEVLAAAQAPETLALHDCFPDLGLAVQGRLAVTLRYTEPETLLQALRRFPALVREWGSRLHGTHAKAPEGPDGQTVLALRAAYRPKQNWVWLAALPEPDKSRAVAAALVLLEAHPSRRAFLELGNCLGLRWLPTLAAAAAASREGAGATGARLDHLYRTYELPKKSGGTRLITVPPYWLKRLQVRINEVLLTPLGAHPCAHGFVRGRSIVSNAQGHVGHQMVVDCDIKGAFPSVSWRLVRYALKRDLGDRLGLQALLLLVDLCCHAGGLPIGAPTSPALLNRVLLVADQVLLAEAERRKVVYTRYADDLCFSGDALALELLPVARRVLASAGLALDPRKTNVFRRGRRQMVTGLVVNDKASTPRRMRRRLRAAVHRVESGREPTWHGKPMDTQCLMGRLAFMKMVNGEEAGRLVQRLKAAIRSGR